jgi:hypothetical protein
MDAYGVFLSRNVFGSLLYWILAVSSAAYYIYIRGFPKIHSFFYAFFMPLFVGYGIAAMVYYMLYVLSAYFMVAVGYIVILLLVLSLFYTTWFLITLYFSRGKRLNPALRKSVMAVSLVTSFGLLILSLCTLLIKT